MTKEKLNQLRRKADTLPLGEERKAAWNRAAMAERKLWNRKGFIRFLADREHPELPLGSFKDGMYLFIPACKVRNFKERKGELPASCYDCGSVSWDVV